MAASRDDTITVTMTIGQARALINSANLTDRSGLRTAQRREAERAVLYLMAALHQAEVLS